jgi:hypothetical protein
MKKLLTAMAVTAFAMAATADTVVWYDFDGLDNAGTSVSRGSTIQNKANAGTLDATVIAVHHGQVAKDSDSAHMPESVIGYPSGQRVYDPVGGLFATSADGAIQFTAPIPDNTYDGNDGGALYIAETSGELSTDKFTLEMTIRIDAEFASDGTYQTIAAKAVSGSSTDYAWEVAWYNHSLVFRAYNTSAANNDSVAWVWGNIADGEWHHIAIVVDPSANATYPVLPYLDYAARDRARYSSIGGAGPMVIGARYNVSSLTYSHPARCVAISEFRFSNAPLSADMFLKARNVPIGTTLAHVKFDDGTVNAADEYGTLCAGVNAAVSGGSPATFSDDVPGAWIINGECGAVLTRKNAKSLSFAGGQVKWSDINDTYFLRKTLAGEDLTSWTIEFWMKATVNQTQWAKVVGTLDDGKYYSPSYSLAFNSVSTITLREAGNSFQINPGASVAICDGKWHHIAITVAPNVDDSAKSDVKLYIDYGRENGGYTGTAINQKLLKHPDNVNFFLGSDGGNSSFVGLVDELRISAGALVPSQFMRAESAPGFIMIVR